MNDGPTNRINRPSAGWPGNDDAHTQRAYQPGGSAAPPTSHIHRGDPTQVSPQAWSQDSGESGYYGDYYPDAPNAYSDAGDAAPRAWFRSAPTYLLALAAVAVLTAGGGLAYTLTSSDHPAPAHPSVQPAPQQGNNDVAPAPQAPPPAQDQPPAPAPDAPVSAPDDGSGSAPNFVPAPQQVQAPEAQVPQQQPDPIQQVPIQHPDPNQQFPNNQPPNNGQFPNNQQHPGHHHPPNNPENQQNQNGNGNAPQNQNQNQNGNGNAPQNQNQNAPQNQNGNQKPQKPESANDTLCHPKPPPC